MRRRRRPDPVCRVAGCGNRVEGWQHMCRPCFARLPGDQRRAIGRAGGERDFGQVARLAGIAVAWLSTHTPAAETARRMGETL